MLILVLFRPKETQARMHSDNTKGWKQQPPAQHPCCAATLTTSTALHAGAQALAHSLEHAHAHDPTHNCYSCSPSYSHQLRIKDELISGPDGPSFTSANAHTVKRSHFHADSCAFQTKRDTSMHAQ